MSGALAGDGSSSSDARPGGPSCAIAGGPDDNAAEFAAYRLLHSLAACGSALPLVCDLRRIPRRLLAHRFISHALAAAAAYRQADWVRLLRLYADAPRMVPYLLDLFLDRMRAAAAAALTAAYRLHGPAPQAQVPESWLAAQLGLTAGQRAQLQALLRGAASRAEAVC